MGLNDHPQLVDNNGVPIRYVADIKAPSSVAQSSIPPATSSLENSGSPLPMSTDRPYFQQNTDLSRVNNESPISPLQQGLSGMSISAPLPAQVLNLSDGEQDLLLKANANIAGWQGRLFSAFDGNVSLNCDMTSILALAKDRRATLNYLAIDAGTVMSSPSFVEMLVRAFETFSMESIAKSLILESVKKITIINSGVNAAKSISYQPEMFELIFSGKFEIGDMYDTQEIKTIVAHLLRMSERWLSTFFTGTLLPAFQARINAAFGKTVPIVFDIDSIVQLCSNPDNQLKVLQTITYETGITRQFWQLSDSSGRKITQLIDRMRGIHTREHEIEKIKDDLTLPVNERLDSPNVLLPMMFAFERACQTPSVAQVLRDSISEIHFRMLPGYNPDAKSLVFYRNLSEQPVPLAEFYTNQIPKNLILVYTGCFEAGEKGCYNRYDWDLFLQQYFLIKERVLMDSLFRETIPDFQTRLQSTLFHPVKIDIDWTSMFPISIAADASKRLAIAQPLCDNHSAHVLLPIVQALEQVSEDSTDARTRLSEINRIFIECTHEPGAPVRVTLEPGESLGTETTAHASWKTLHCVYPLEKASGYYDLLEMKNFLRTSYELPVPAAETGFSGMTMRLEHTARKAGDELQKLGNTLTASVNKILHQN